MSALIPAAMKQMDDEVHEKLIAGQARRFPWHTLRLNPPRQLKISLVAMVPHKSRPFRAILDLSFSTRISATEVVPSVNSTTTKLAPKGSIDQLGHSLNCIIHAVATTNHDEHVFWAKWDIKDGFWRLDCEDGKEWNFAYVLPSSHGKDPILIVPTSLQMGWIESPPYFCAASETARDVTETYSQRPLGSLPPHKFLHYTQILREFRELAATTTDPNFRYLLEVFVDDFIAGVIAKAQSQLNHVALAVLHGIHDVVPPDKINANNAISERKLIKGNGAWAHVKEILGTSLME